MFSQRPTRHTWIIYLIFDVYAITLAYFSTLLLRFGSTWSGAFYNTLNSALGVNARPEAILSYEDFYIDSSFRIITLLSISICMLYGLFDLYSKHRLIPNPYGPWKIIQANAIALLVFFGYFYLSGNEFHPRSFFGTLAVLNTIYTIIGHALVRRLVIRLRRRGVISMSQAIHVSDESPDPQWGPFLDSHGITLSATYPLRSGDAFEDDLAALVHQLSQTASDLLLCTNTQLSPPQLMRLLAVTESNGMATKIYSPELDILIKSSGLPVDQTQGIPIAHFESPSHTLTSNIASTVWSTCLCIPLALFTIALTPLITLAIRLSGPGPIFFIQERIGINRKPFLMIKFRTMYNDADEQQAQLEEFNESGDGLFKIKKDPRITSIGRILRRFSIDEFPQVINVFRGEMAAVGPRPLPRRDFESYYEDWHYTRHNGLPGLTCLWTISGRSDVKFHDMCILDVYYLRNRSLMLDLKILLRTVGVVLFGKGAY